MKAQYFLLLLILVVAGGLVQAHHAAAPHYDLNEIFTLEGVVTELRLVNPHGFLYFDVTTDGGDVENWRCSLSSANRMKRRGWNDGTLLPGQKITITASPARREERHCFFQSLVMIDGQPVDSTYSVAESSARGGAGASVQGNSSSGFEYYLPNGQPNMAGPWYFKAPDAFFGTIGAGGMGRPNALAQLAGGGTGAGGPAAGLPQASETGKQAAEGYNPLYDMPGLSCHPGSIINSWTGGDSTVNEIEQEEDKITLRYGYMDLVRTIHLDHTEFPDDITPSIEGYSIGRWEDDVLVVSSGGFEEGVLIRGNGIRHSEQMEVLERFELSQDGQTLTRSFTVHDPLYLTEDWVGQHVLHITSRRLAPYECLDLEGANNERSSDSAE